MTSNKIKVFVGDQEVGVIQSMHLLEPKDNSNDEAFPENLQANRIRFDTLKVAKAFNHQAITAINQRHPLQIIFVDANDQEIGRVTNAWITATHSAHSSADVDWVVVEGIELEAESVSGKIE